MTTTIDYTSLAKRLHCEQRNALRAHGRSSPGTPSPKRARARLHTLLSRIAGPGKRCRHNAFRGVQMVSKTRLGNAKEHTQWLQTAACRNTHVKGSYLKSLPILLPLSGIPGSGHILCPWDTPT